MKQLFKVFSLAVLLSVFSIGFAGAQTIAQDRQVAPFSGLVLQGTVKVELSQGTSHSVVVEAPEAEQELITVTSAGKGEFLKVSGKTGSNALVKITTPNLATIKLSDASSLKCINTLTQESLRIEAGGATTMNMLLDIKSLDVDLSGATVATMAGKAADLNLKMGGAAQGKLDSLQVRRAIVQAQGASSGKIQVAEKVEGKVTGAASIAMVQEPEVNQLEVSSVAAMMGEVDEQMPEEQKIGDVVKEIKMAKTKKGKKFNGHFKGVELGINTYVNRDNELKLPDGAEYMTLKMPNSLTVNLNLLEANLPIIRHYVGLVTGLGIEFNNYKFEQSNFIRSDSTGIIAIPAAPISFEKSKLACSYLKIPFILEFQTNSDSKKNSFHIAGGANFGLRLRSHTKYKYEDAGKSVKEKEWDRFYLNPYRAAAIVKFGWGPLNFFAEYNLLTMFDKGKGPELYPVSFGIALANWD
jgi:hypothetical protein